MLQNKWHKRVVSLKIPLSLPLPFTVWETFCDEELYLFFIDKNMSVFSHQRPCNTPTGNNFSMIAAHTHRALWTSIIDKSFYMVAMETWEPFVSQLTIPAGKNR